MFTIRLPRVPLPPTTDSTGVPVKGVMPHRPVDLVPAPGIHSSQTSLHQAEGHGGSRWCTVSTGTAIEWTEVTWNPATGCDRMRGIPAAVRFLSLERLLGPVPSLELSRIDWVIVGGESGPAHRALDLAWVRDIRDQCVDLRAALFFKQVGGLTSKAGGRLLDGRTWDEYPDTADRAGV